MDYRLLSEAQMLELCAEPTLDLAPAKARAAYSRGDVCAAAFIKSELAGYCWFAFSAAPHMDRAWIDFPSEVVYTYKSYVRPVHRGRGIAGALYRFADPLWLGRGRRRAMICVESHNRRINRRREARRVLVRGLRRLPRRRAFRRVALAPGRRLTDCASSRRAPSRMPYAFAHPAAVVPLARLLGPRAVPSALAIGSMVPDAWYLVPLVEREHSHAGLSGIAFCLVAGLLAYMAFHLVFKQPLLALFPRRIAACAANWMTPGLPAVPWRWVMISLLAGIGTHLVWDAFTHRGQLRVRRGRSVSGRAGLPRPAACEHAARYCIPRRLAVEEASRGAGARRCSAGAACASCRRPGGHAYLAGSGVALGPWIPSRESTGVHGCARPR